MTKVYLFRKSIERKKTLNHDYIYIHHFNLYLGRWIVDVFLRTYNVLRTTFFRRFVYHSNI